jgi:putative hydrolase of HD superfamily
MPAVRKSLLQLTFSGSFMRRWNDKACPVPLYEIDKQAHKMIVAWLLTELNDPRPGMPQNASLGREVMERGIFDYLYRLIVTDIKPPVLYRLRANRHHQRELTQWVLKELQPVLEPLGEDFWSRFAHYHQTPEHNEPADRILAAAHFFASEWEFKLIYPHNVFDEERDDIAQSFVERLTGLRDVPGVEELLAGSGSELGRFANLCGQLRFQIRWSSTPRLPATTVLGHLFLVACFAYYFSLSIGAGTARTVNNFFAGLFHDLPELLTRDIITPVKRSVPELARIIRECETAELERRVFNPLRQGGHVRTVERLSYYLGMATGSEFHDTVRDADGRVRRLDGFEALHAHNAADEMDPKDGSMLKVCDTLAAFIEAHASVRGGVSSTHLLEAIARIRAENRHKTVGPISLGTLLADFD